MGMPREPFLAVAGVVTIHTATHSSRLFDCSAVFVVQCDRLVKP